MTKLNATVTKVDKRLFDSICIDKVFIYIGSYKEIINEAGIYNQICDYFNHKRKLEKFFCWLCKLYNTVPTDEIPEEIIEQWQNKLILNTKATVYSEVLRIERSSDQGYNFYAIKNRGNELRFLCGMDENPSYMTQLRQFLKYNDICTAICDAQNLEHPMEKSDKEIRQDIDRCLRYRLIPIIEKVSILANHKETPCLAYYDFKLGNKENPTPAWDSFMSTIPNDGSKECFMAFIYSIFKGDNFGKQMLWIHGVGDSGKSKVVQTLKKRLEALSPHIVGALAPTFFQDKFTSISHVSKRLVVAQDWADRSIVRSQLIKNITGNDDANIRGMGQEAKSANIYSKLLISSNFAPWLNPNKSEELSRMLYILLDPELVVAARTAWTIYKGNWANFLLLEVDDFVAKCAQPYFDRLTEDGHNIKIYDTMVDKLSSATFLTDNMKIWWENCTRHFIATSEKKDNVLYYDDLCEDYKRFLGNRGRNPRYVKGILSALIPFLLEHGITIHALTDTNNSKYILGYEWIEKDADDRCTLDDVLEKRADEIGAEGMPVGQVFAHRKPEDMKGWKVGKKFY